MRDEIDPKENKLDSLALKFITGVDTKNLDEKEIERLTNEFKGLLTQNIEIMRKNDKKYMFLKKLKLDCSSPKALTDVRNGSETTGTANVLNLGIQDDADDETLLLNHDPGT